MWRNFPPNGSTRAIYQPSVLMRPLVQLVTYFASIGKRGISPSPAVEELSRLGLRLFQNFVRFQTLKMIDSRQLG